MTTHMLSPTWTVLKKTLRKQKHGQLTDADLLEMETGREDVLGRLQKCLGLSQFQIAWLVEEAIERNVSTPLPAMAGTYRTEESPRLFLSAERRESENWA
jgi:hypothetical protein